MQFTLRWSFWRVFSAVALAAFFASLLWLSAGVDVVNSPDEAANLFFAERFAESGQLYFVEPLNEVVDGVVAGDCAYELFGAARFVWWGCGRF